MKLSNEQIVHRQFEIGRVVNKGDGKYQHLDIHLSTILKP
jgi:hypothetical protein